MDPNACWKRFVDAVQDGDADEAENAAADMAAWLRKGGFVPARLNALLPNVRREKLVEMFSLGSILFGAVAREDGVAT